MKGLKRVIVGILLAGAILAVLLYAYRELKFRNQIIDYLLAQIITQKEEPVVIVRQVEGPDTQEELIVPVMVTEEDLNVQVDIGVVQTRPGGGVSESVRRERAQTGMGYAPILDVVERPLPVVEAPVQPAVMSGGSSQAVSSAVERATERTKGAAERMQRMLQQQAAKMKEVEQPVEPVIEEPLPAVEPQPKTSAKTPFGGMARKMQGSVKKGQERVRGQAEGMIETTRERVLPQASEAISTNVDVDGASGQYGRCTRCAYAGYGHPNKGGLITRLNELNRQLIELYDWAIQAYRAAGISMSDGYIQYVQREKNVAERELRMYSY